MRTAGRLLALALLQQSSCWHVTPHHHHLHRRTPLLGVPASFATARAGPVRAAASEQRSSGASAALRTLNSSTKWLVVFAQTTAVWSRRDFVAPFIVLGSIIATFGTATLKELINERRPDGAPFTDPGMPSSHALVSTFAAVGWALQVRSAVPSAILLSCAALVSLLRVSSGPAGPALLSFCAR